MARWGVRFGRFLTWRRGVLLVAAVGVALALGRRDDRLVAWSAGIEARTEALLAGERGPAGTIADDFMQREAERAIAELKPPVTRSGLQRGTEDRPLVAVIEVTGVENRRVRLTWAGDPPRLIGVDRERGATNAPEDTRRPPDRSREGTAS